MILTTITNLKIEKSILYWRGWLQHPENVPDCSLPHVQPLLKISWKSVHSCSRNVANRHGFSRKCSKRYSMFKGLNRTHKCSRLFLVPSSSYPDNFMKNRSRVANRHTDKQTHKPTEMKTYPLSSGRGNKSNSLYGMIARSFDIYIADLGRNGLFPRSAVLGQCRIKSGARAYESHHR